MNINASIIDQRLAGVQDEIRERASAELRITREDLPTFTSICSFMRENHARFGCG